MLCVVIGACVLSVGRVAAEDARVLPKGIFRFTYARSATSGIREEYDSSGQARSLTAPYQLSLDAKTLSGIEDGATSLLRYMNEQWPFLRYNSSGISRDPNDPLLQDDVSRGQLNVDAEGSRTQNTFALMYGLTDRISIGLVVPRVSTSVRTSASITGNNSAELIHSYFASDESGALAPVVDGISKLSQLQVENLQAVLQKQAYNRFESTEQSGFGDVSLGGRMNYYNSHKWLHSVQAGLSVPTGELKNPASLTEIDQGSGAWQVSLAQITNFKFSNDWMLSGGLHYTRSFQGSRRKRTYSTDTSSIDAFLPGSNREEEVSFTIGDKASANLGLDYTLSTEITLGAGYEMSWKGSDVYAGGFADGDYERMSSNTHSRLRAMQVSVGFSAVNLFQRKKFPLPLEASLTMVRPLSGVNTIIAPFWTGEISMYF